MQDNLIGYLMNGLTIEETISLEQTLATDEQLAAELRLLRIALIPLEADREHIDAPSGLALRTCRRIHLFRNGRDN